MLKAYNQPITVNNCIMYLDFLAVFFVTVKYHAKCFQRFARNLNSDTNNSKQI